MSSPGCRQGAELTKNAGTTPITPDRPLTYLEWPGQNHVLGKFATWARESCSDRAGYSKDDAENVLVVALFSVCTLRCAAYRSARSGKKAPF
uniref:Uncharacterized protein n=1 Tax=Hyaloperonospora arabidopsidis (strain Emoy2) TaxID=559515 RepID=M4BG40_HYAAE